MWGWKVLVLLILLIGGGMVAREYRKSFGVWEQNRFNLVVVEKERGEVSFVSYDPVENKTILIKYPSNLTINSRSVGEYSVGNLYKLGAYEQKGGEFSRRKVQGFMRIPILGYVVGKGSLQSIVWRSIWQTKERESNLSRLDAWYLWMVLGKHTVVEMGQEELIRAGVIVDNESEGEVFSYSPERLEQYLGERFFDWKIGQEGATVAVVNNSGIDGMGRDMAKFLTNMGLDVVMVRSGSEILEHTVVLTNSEIKREKAITSLERVFDFDKPKEDLRAKEFRADIVIEVGKDALGLF